MPRTTRCLLPLVVVLVSPAALTADEKVDFARDVRPILSNRCFKCHGPAVQRSKLRLDTFEGATKGGVIVPGKPDQSPLIARVTEPSDEDGRMPPPEVGDRLTPAEIATLRAWIEQGAEYTPHWAFQP